LSFTSEKRTNHKDLPTFTLKPVIDEAKYRFFRWSLNISKADDKSKKGRKSSKASQKRATEQLHNTAKHYPNENYKMRCHKLLVAQGTGIFMGRSR